MASVAKCPQCEHDLLIPDGADLAAWAKCPACSAFFQLEEVTLRNVARPILVDSDFAPVKSHDEDEMDADSASHADEHELSESEWQPQNSSFSKTLADFNPSAKNELAASTNEPIGEVAQGDTEIRQPDSWFKHKQVTPRLADIKSIGAPLESTDEAASQKKPVLEPTERPVLSENAEVATPRIDKWFRSANTVADLRPVVPEARAEAGLRPLTDDLGHAAELEPLHELDAHTAEDASTSDTHSPDEWGSTDLDETPTIPTARTLADFAPQQPVERGGATVEFSPDALSAADDDFELVGPSATPQKTRPWDDSEHMERLLADVDPNSLEPVAPVIHQSATPAGISYGEDDAASWMMSHPPRSPRKRSVVRTLATTVVGGLFGLGIGYCAWLWAVGPRGDFMEVAQYLPSAMLPSSFQQIPVQITHDTTAAPPSEAETASEPKPEVQARFETEADAPKAVSPDSITDERYGSAPATPSSEPPKFEEPPVVSPLGETASVPPVHAVADAPTYKADELAVALRVAQDAKAGLVTGDLGDSKAVQQTKGRSYASLCELAEKLTFVDTSSRADYVTALSHDAERLFREILSDAHTRGEVARIAPIWTSSANRHIGGIFFAGDLTALPGQEIIEGQVDLGGGTSIPVLLSKELASHLEGAGKPMGVVGSIIVDPAKRVTGYTGKAQQVVWVHSLIPLE